MRHGLALKCRDIWNTRNEYLRQGRLSTIVMAVTVSSSAEVDKRSYTLFLYPRMILTLFQRESAARWERGPGQSRRVTGSPSSMGSQA